MNPKSKTPSPRRSGSMAEVAFLVAVVASGAGCKQAPSAQAHTPTKPVRISLDSPTSLGLGFLATTDVAARVSYVDDGMPAANVSVTFAMTGQTADATLVTNEAVSNANGQAVTTLAAGKNMARVIVTATAAEPTGAPIDATASTAQAVFHVDGVPRSKLLVKYAFAGEAPIVRLSTFVYSTSNANLCSHLSMPSLPPGYLRRQEVVAATAGSSALGATPTLEHTHFMVGATLGVAVLGYGIDPSRPVAVGCVDLPALGASPTTAATVALSAWN